MCSLTPKDRSDIENYRKASILMKFCLRLFTNIRKKNQALWVEQISQKIQEIKDYVTEEHNRFDESGKEKLKQGEEAYIIYR
jgi:hypothetical protein